MKNSQLKDLSIPDSSSQCHPRFAWMKTDLIGDDFITWWLFYGYADGTDTLSSRVYHPRRAGFSDRTRTALAFSLRDAKTQVRDLWHARYPGHDRR